MSNYKMLTLKDMATCRCYNMSNISIDTLLFRTKLILFFRFGKVKVEAKAPQEVCILKVDIMLNGRHFITSTVCQVGILTFRHFDG
jgi:hypothetical protein